MVDVRGDVLRPPHGTTPAAVKSNKNQKAGARQNKQNDLCAQQSLRSAQAFAQSDQSSL